MVNTGDIQECLKICGQKIADFHFYNIVKNDFGFWRVKGYNSSLMTMAWEYITMKYFTTKGDEYNPSGIVARPSSIKASPHPPL